MICQQAALITDAQRSLTNCRLLSMRFKNSRKGRLEHPRGRDIHSRPTCGNFCATSNGWQSCRTPFASPFSFHELPHAWPKASPTAQAKCPTQLQSAQMAIQPDRRKTHHHSLSVRYGEEDRSCSHMFQSSRPANRQLELYAHYKTNQSPNCFLNENHAIFRARLTSGKRSLTKRYGPQVR
jgi:hypothetical protein